MAICGGSVKDIKSRKFWTALFAEFLGTLLLVLVGCGSCLNGGTRVDIALAFGLSVASIVWAICRVSGGHINPAVTMGFLATRKISCVRALFYMLVQSVGAICGAALLKALVPSEVKVNNAVIFDNSALGSSTVGTGVSVGQAFGVEFCISFIFVFVVLASCDPDRKDLGGSIPLAVGLTISMCHLFAVPLTGSGMNPARALGPALISGNLDNHWLYWVAPLLAGVVGGRMYDLIFAVNATPAKCKGTAKLDYDDRNFDQNGPKPESAGPEGDELRAV